MHYALCPYCLSILQITEDQLTLRAELVRCGHCSEVFNAYKNKLSEPDKQRLIKDTEEQRNKEEPSIEKPAPNHQTTENCASESPAETKEPSWETTQTKKRSSFPFGLLSFVFLLLLAGQIIYINSDSLVQTPSLQPFFKQANKAFGFHIPTYRSINDIQVVERQLKPHATLQNVLTLQFTMKNTALVEQNYPNIHLILTSSSSEKVAQNTFTKFNYLQDNESHDFFKPQSLKFVSLSFKKPQKNALGYEISFSF